MFSLDDNNKLYYEIESCKDIEEVNLQVITLIHKVTKAKIILMISDDKNRVFNIAFKTPVKNSKGTPHILEHSVLCGSRKYDVKDPFIELAKSSVNTFLNAMTYPDKTCYPVASANLKDFHNLMDVYLDAVFYPNAVKNDKIFKQEGWHYEIEDKSLDLNVNGVVLNEMRGVYSNPDDILESDMLKNLYGGTNYEYEYGGYPFDIIDLDYDEFKNFHKRYYSPSNAIIYFYGALDYNYELRSLQENYLKDFDYIDVDASFTDVKDFKKDNEITSYYNVDTENLKNKAYITCNFAMDEEKNGLSKIVMQIIDYILFSSESAILRNKFLEAGYGESIYTVCEYSVKKAFYSIIVQNIDENKKESFIKLLYNSIRDLVENGIDVERLKAAINIFHFNYAEGEYGRMPKGLVYTLTSLETYLYGEDPTALIRYKDAFDFLLKLDLSDKGNIFYKTIQRVFLDNNHRCINLLLPKKGYAKEKNDLLNEILKKRKKTLSDIELTKIIDSSKELKMYQKEKDSEEALSCIPTLKISDLESDGKFIDYEKKKVADTDIIITEDNDREVVYMDVHFDISGFIKEEIYLMSLINIVLSKIDLKTMSYADFDNYIAENSGGIDIKLNIYEKMTHFSLAVKSFYDKCDEGLSILEKLIRESIFKDADRIGMLIEEEKANDFVSVLSSGHISAINRAESTVTYQAKIIDKVHNTGIARNLFLRYVSEAYRKNSTLFNDAMELLFKKAISKKLYYSVSVSEKYSDKAKVAFENFDKKIESLRREYEFTKEDEDKLKSKVENISKIIPFDDFDKKVKKEAIVVPTDVNFVSIANKFSKNGEIGRLSLLKTLFNYEYLWTNIRVLGGAYGCMSFFKRSGNYDFVSYRDPNLKKTNDTFYGIYDYLKNIDMSYDMIEKYIIGSVGVYDNPVSIVDNYKKNVAAYFNGTTNDEIKKERANLLSMKPSDLKELSEVFADIKESEAVAIICEKDMSEAEKMYDKAWKLSA